MGRLIAAALVVGVAASIALVGARSQASASGSGDPRIAVLQTQVKALQRQVTDLRQELSLNYEGDTCSLALVADVIQGSWITLDQASQKTTYGPQSQVPDYGTCKDLANPQVPRSSPITSPPTINPLLPLLKWLGG